MKHLKVNNETYLSHLKFACNVGVTLITRGVIFVCHGLFPFCEVRKSTERMEQPRRGEKINV